MKPPYEINATMLKLITSISEKIGAVNAKNLVRETLNFKTELNQNYSFLSKHRGKHFVRRSGFGDH